jgi:hypothetical protein
VRANLSYKASYKDFFHFPIRSLISSPSPTDFPVRHPITTVFFEFSCKKRQNFPKSYKQFVLKVRFDSAGNVASVSQTGTELISNISPEGDKTPTLGRETSFFEEIFGNIGAVGAGGAQGATPNSPN